MIRKKFRRGYNLISRILGIIEDVKFSINTSRLSLALLKRILPTEVNDSFSMNGDWLYVGNNRLQDETTYLSYIKKLGIEIFDDGDYGIYQDISVENLSLKNRRRLSAYLMKRPNIKKLLLYSWVHILCPNDLLFLKNRFNLRIHLISWDDMLAKNWSLKLNYGVVGYGNIIDRYIVSMPQLVDYYDYLNLDSVYIPMGLLENPTLNSKPRNDLIFNHRILFIGNRYGYREEIVSFLKNHGLEIDCFGRGWENGSLPANKIANMVTEYKIILGVANVGHSRTRHTLKLRDYESAFFGAYYLTNYTEKRLKQLSSVIIYDDKNDCLKKIRQLLDESNKPDYISRSIITSLSWENIVKEWINEC